MPVFVDELIAENQHIIKSLMELQKERYLSSLNQPKISSTAAPKPGIISDEIATPFKQESILANVLLENLAALTRWSKPSDVKKGIQSELGHVATLYSEGRLQSCWRGELNAAGGKLKAIATNIVGDPNFGM